MSAGKEEWKKTGKNMGGAFEGLAKAIVRTGTAGFEKAAKWAAEEKEAENNGSSVFKDGTWRETGKDLGKAFKGLGGSILGSVERGAQKAEEWAENTQSKADEKVNKAADMAETKAAGFKEAADKFEEGLKKSDGGEKNVIEAEIISEEIIDSED